MRPFFKHYGGKWLISRKCYRPLSGLPIVEPFCGAAGYSVRYGEGLVVHLYDTCPITVGIWEYLLGASQADILALPVAEIMRDGMDIRDLGLKEGAIRLIQRWLTPQGSMSNYRAPPIFREVYASQRNLGACWSEVIRQRTANQLPGIARWTITRADYQLAPDIEATWHVDPPYQHNASSGVYGHFVLDYLHLREWCCARRGLVMVHEQLGADWLTFETLNPHAPTGRARKGKRGKQHEVWWTNFALPRPDPPAL